MNGSVSKESSCNEGDHLQCRRPRSDPWIEKIPLEKEMATHSSILAWRTPWTEESGDYSPWGHRVRYALATKAPPPHPFIYLVIILTLFIPVLCAVLCLVAQSCVTLCNPMDYSPPGSSVHGDSLGKNTGVGCHALQGIFSTQGSNPDLPHCRQILYHLSHCPDL